MYDTLEVKATCGRTVCARALRVRSFRLLAFAVHINFISYIWNLYIKIIFLYLTGWEWENKKIYTNNNNNKQPYIYTHKASMIISFTFCLFIWMLTFEWPLFLPQWEIALMFRNFFELLFFRPNLVCFFVVICKISAVSFSSSSSSSSLFVVFSYEWVSS